MSDNREHKGEHHEAHHVNYKKIYFVLLGLLVVSVIGPEFGILWVTLITAFGVAFIKANLVIQNFMHLRTEKRIIKWTLVTSVVLMGVFFAGVAPDVMKHEGTRWVNDAALAAIERGLEAPHKEGDEAQVAGGAHEGGEAAEVAQAPEPAFDPKGAYAAVCATCHGPAGAGDGPGSAALNPKPASFADPAFWASRDDATVVKAIREGGAAIGKSALMPAWGGLYNEAQAQAIAEYMKTFQK